MESMSDPKTKLCNKLLENMRRLQEESKAIERRILDLNETYLDVVNGWIVPEDLGQSDE
jgi:hypothetical protein